MKRHLLIAAVFLLAGAVVNVAVAWGFAYQGGLRAMRGRQITFHESSRYWHERRPALWEGGSVIEVNRLQGVGRTLTVARGHESPSGPITTDPNAGDGFRDRARENKTFYMVPAVIMEAEFGWPIRSFGWTDVYGLRYLHRSPTLTVSGLRLPLLPAWPGVAVNTLLYATVLWLLICGPFALRRFVHVRRDLCPACAYPRGGSDVCSECGRPLPVRARATT